MSSSGKRKTTMAKLMRESKLRERRQDKQAKKDARKLASGDGADRLGDQLSPMSVDAGQPESVDSGQPDSAQPPVETVSEA
jgi:hypothetical protein